MRIFRQALLDYNLVPGTLFADTLAAGGSLVKKVVKGRKTIQKLHVLKLKLVFYAFIPQMFSGVYFFPLSVSP